MRRVLGFAVVGLALLAFSAAAQTANPVVEHYRAYRAALDLGELATAETEAAAALAASEARDGDGGRTGVLALNLAIVRLMRGDRPGAVAPAAKALALSADAAAGVDRLHAQLIAARADLGAGETRAAEPLRSAIEAAEARPDLVTDAYEGAVELATWLFSAARHREAREAWALAGRLAQGSRYGPAFGRGHARAGEGAALMMSELTRAPYLIDVEEARAVDALFDDAMAALAPLALQTSESGQMTVAQSAYAGAMAWSRALRAQMGDDADRLDRDDQDDRQVRVRHIGLPRGAGPVCRWRAETQPRPHYPAQAERDLNVGAVVVWLRFDANGEVAERRVAAAVGGAEFARSVEQVLPQWRFTLDGAAPPACRVPSSSFRSVLFRFS